MTILSTIITRHYTAHASDSFITVHRPDGKRDVVEAKKSKLVQVRAWRGIVGYWGLAQHGNDWKTVDWLRARADRANEYDSAEAFADSLAAALTTALAGRTFARPLDVGLGIHFTAYEYIDDRWVPELFVINNWTDASYTAVRPEGFRVTRETYATLKNLSERSAEHGKHKYRLEVHAALHNAPLMFRFNNGDPALFNPVAASIQDSVAELSRRGQLKDPSSAETHLAIARSPIDIVSKLLKELAVSGTKLVGGKLHDLAVSPGGVYKSQTGDC